MQPDLAEFLALHKHQTEEEVVWGAGSIRLRVRCSLTDETPPLEYITSIRSLIFQGNSLLVMRNPDDTHIYPGGRREGNVSLGETLRREVLEETGWEITGVAPLGLIHFHHLTPPPPDYPYPHPDFIQVVHMAEAARFVPGARLENDYEMEVNFRPIAEARAMTLSPGQHLFLRAALEARS